MEKLIICFGLISCLWIGVFGQGTVTVGEDISVKPTPSPLNNPDDKVDVTLTCTGSSSELSFYIQNRIEWYFIAPDGSKENLTQTFYKHPSNQYAGEGFASGHFSLKYGPDSTKNYAFSLSINGVTHSDNGVYRCSLLNGSKVEDSKDMRLTVLHPVDRVSIEILNGNKETLHEKHTPINEGEESVELTPGDYYVRCTATGSNPAPVMSLFYNEQRPSVSVKNAVNPSGNRVKNTGTFEKMIKVSAHTMPQDLVCEANIPGNDYMAKQAGLTMMVQVDKPDMMCSNFSAMLGSRYATVQCNISAGGKSNQGLVCEKVSWVIGNEKQTIEFDQRWKDPNKKLDIMESRCEEGSHGLLVSLQLFTVKTSHFSDLYWLVYGLGEKSHRIPVQLHEITTAGVAGIESSLSLLIAVVMAAVAKHLVL